jgi:hypothetical protein
MEISIQLPDDIANQFGNAAVDLPREILEAFAIQNYRSQKITRHQVTQLLGLDYWQTEDLLAKHDAKQIYTLADLEVDRASLRLNDAQ